MSAFLLFSQGRRADVRKQNPDIKNTEVSRILGELWRGSTDEEKKPFVEKEKELREKYKVEMEGWKEKAGERKEEEMKRQKEQMEQRLQYEYAVKIAQPQHQHSGMQQQGNYYGQSVGYTNSSSYQLYPQGHASMYQHPGCQSQYGMFRVTWCSRLWWGCDVQCSNVVCVFIIDFIPANYSQPVGFHYQSAVKQQPVILGPNGMPHYQPQYHQQMQQPADERDAKPQYDQASYRSEEAAKSAPASFDSDFGSGYLDLDS